MKKIVSVLSILLIITVFPLCSSIITAEETDSPGVITESEGEDQGDQDDTVLIQNEMEPADH